MAANGFDLSSFFTEREPSGPISLYQTITAHPFCREFSLEELRLKHYNLCQEETRSHLTNTSKLMATRQLSALEVAHLARPFRVAAEPIRTGMGDAQKYVFSNDTYVSTSQLTNNADSMATRLPSSSVPKRPRGSSSTKP